MKILLANAFALIRKNGHYDILPNTDIVVNDDKIVYIGPKQNNEKYDRTIDCTYKLVMAGLVNAHGHAAMTLLRGVGSGLPLQEWLNNAIFPIEDKLTPDMVYKGTKLAIAEMLASGTTLFSEMYDFPYAAMKAISETKAKGNVCRVGLCFNPNPNEDDIRLHECIDVVKVGKGIIDSNDEIKKELKTDKLPENIKNSIKDGHIVGDFCIHSEYLTKEWFVKEIAKYNKELQANLQVHVSESIRENITCMQDHKGLSPIAYFEQNDVLLNNKVYAAHCVNVSDDDLKIMAKHGVSLIHNPTSNLKLGNGIAPIRKAFDAGVNVCLGTDGCASNNNLNMFEEMHLAAILPGETYKAPGMLTCDQILDMATINGAKAMGRYDTGLLEVGYKADIIAIDLARPHFVPLLDISPLLIYSAQASDVCLTMVDGNVLYIDGSYTTIDIVKTVEEVREVTKELYLGK